jgi:hypothetical protein
MADACRGGVHERDWKALRHQRHERQAGDGGVRPLSALQTNLTIDRCTPWQRSSSYHIYVGTTKACSMSHAMLWRLPRASKGPAGLDSFEFPEIVEFLLGTNRCIGKGRFSGNATARAQQSHLTPEKQGSHRLQSRRLGRDADHVHPLLFPLLLRRIVRRFGN